MRRVKAETMDECAKLLKALSDDARLKIVALLFDREHCVTELVERLGLSQPLVSHHLAILRSAGIVKVRKDGRRVFYSLNPDFCQKLERGEEIDFGCCSLRFKIPRAVR